MRRCLQEVSEGAFPGHRFSPYRIPLPEVDALCAELEVMGMRDAASAVRSHAQDVAKEAAAASASAATAIGTKPA